MFRNELLLILSLIVIYSSVLIWYKLFGRSGMYCFTVFATIAANIEALILIDAFGMEMTLGNILFAATFLITDILSETDGKKSAQKAVHVGIATNILFIIISQSWLMYVPSVNDWASPSIAAVFSNTPRMMLSSLTSDAIRNAIIAEDINRIKSIKGIGLKSAQRLILELKDKIVKGGGADTGVILSSRNNAVVEEAVTALVLLGFTKANVNKAISAVIKENPDANLESIIKLALKKL